MLAFQKYSKKEIDETSGVATTSLHPYTADAIA
jgi:hypothetical protein